MTIILSIAIISLTISRQKKKIIVKGHSQRYETIVTNAENKWEGFLYDHIGLLFHLNINMMK